jgi:hypothetical protein
MHMAAVVGPVNSVKARISNSAATGKWERNMPNKFISDLPSPLIELRLAWFVGRTVAALA